MKKFLFFALAALTFAACETDPTGNGKEPSITLYDVVAELVYPAEFAPSEGIEIVAKNSNGTTTTATTDSEGKASFQLPEGKYEFSASDKRALDGYSYTFNAMVSNLVISESTTIQLEMTGSRSGQILIKEIYAGGCQKDDGSGVYQFDKYITIYNNSDQVATLNNFGVGMANPSNAHASNGNYVDGVLSYADQGFTPSASGIWFMQHPITLQPFEEKVIAVNGAINHTTTYTNSVDLSNADYCMYDPEVLANTSYYPAPSETIAVEDYMKVCFIGLGNAWAFSAICPGVFIFNLDEGIDPLAYGQAEENIYYPAGNEGNAVYACVKIPNEAILDVVDIFSAEHLDESLPRFSNTLEAGYTVLTNKLGYTSYRNVDKEATEAIVENEGKLVYGYAKGTVDATGATSTDNSGIDAEASIAAGAKIIYLDTNNSTNDFHQRANAALRD